MKARWIEESFAYNGEQLRSLFAYLKYGLMGDSIVAWQGPCDIPFEHMVDGEDLLQKAAIRGEDMLHFLVEKFEASLFSGVLLQRLLATIVRDEMSKKNAKALELRREGDDLYLGESKLSISIATQSPTSTLVHFAVNVSNEGTPVNTCALQDFEIEPIPLAKNVMQSFCQEVETSLEATQKVKWVR